MNTFIDILTVIGVVIVLAFCVAAVMEIRDRITRKPRIEWRKDESEKRH